MLKPIGMAGVPHVRPAYVVHVRQRCPAKNQRRTTRTTLTRSISDHNEELPISNSSSSCGSSFQATATTTDWGTNILQQQLPPEHTLQQLLQPLIQPSSGSSSTVPGDDVGPIAADSMSLTVNVPPPSPVLTVPGPQQADSASTMVVLDHMLDADSREWGCRTVQMDATAMAAAMAAPAAAAAASAVLTATAQQAPDVDMEQLPATAATKEAGSSWIRVVGVCAFASFLCYLDRTNISTAIVPMAEQFGWSKQFCGSVLSAFFAGYGATQVLGGQLSDKYGGSAVLAAGLAVWSLATALTPAAASAGTLAVLAARFMLGVGQGVAFPAIHALLAKRVPGKARSGAIGIIMACAHCGTAMGFGASPGIITSVGWAWTFYVFGAAALLWMPLWLQLNQGLRESSKQALKVAAAVTTAAVMTSTGVQTARIGTTPAVAVPVAASAMGSSASPKGPSTPPVRSATEQQREAPADQQASSSSTCTNKAAEVSASSNPNVGFWPLMRRKEVWAISVAQYTSGWGYYGLLAWLPQFFMEHCGMQLSQLGSFTLLPYLLQGIVGASAGLLADNLITKRGWKVRNVRIVMQVAGMMGPAVCLFAAAAPCGAHSPYIAAGLITVAMGLSALTCSGVSASHLDIAPRHAGVVFGVGNTAGTLAGLMAIPGIGLVLETTGSWSMAFGLAALHNVVGSVLWTLWVGDKPLPEDGGEATATEPAKQQPVLQNNVVPMPSFIISSMQPEIKLKAA